MVINQIKVNDLTATSFRLCGYYNNNNSKCDLSELGKLIRLKELELEYIDVVDYSFLKNLYLLEKLTIVGTTINDNIDLTNNIKLTHLDFNNVIFNGKIISGTNKNLKTFIFTKCKINNYRFINKFKYLEKLNLGYSNIKKINFVDKLSFLESLDITNTDVSDLSCVKDLTNLMCIAVTKTKIKSLFYLNNLLKLKSVYASNTDIISVSDISHLPKLNNLVIMNTNVETNINFLSKKIKIYR